MKKILILLCFISQLVGVTYQDYNPNDERFKIIALKKAKNLLEKSERDFENASQLYEKQFISQDEMETYKTQYESDKLNYQQYMLSVIFDKPHLSVVSALKYQNQDGEVIVELTLKNSSGGTYALEDDALDDFDTENLKPTTVYNVYISLKDEAGNMISQPYEYHLKEINLSEEKKIVFKLLKDVESVIVSSNYGDKFDEKKIYLKRKSDKNILSITPDLYAQEIESGLSGEFVFNLEYFGEKKEKIDLLVENLPRFFTYEFLNYDNKVAISSVHLTAKSPTQKILLRINVPEKIGENIQLNETIDFMVNFLTMSQSSAGILNLEITPTGKAALLLEMNNLYIKAFKGETITSEIIKLKNNGLVDVTNIRFEIFTPPGWEFAISPEKMEILKMDEIQNAELKLVPDKSTIPGIYQVKIKATGRNRNKSIKSSEYELKIEIENKTNPFVVIIAVIAIVAVIAGLIGFIKKIMKN